MIIIDGRAYARVSEILKPFSDFSHIDRDVLANKCRIGTQVHAAIEAEIAGEFPILQADSYGYFKSFLKWKLELEPTFEQSERRYFSDKHMLTGQIDALVSWKPVSGYPVLVDFKTSASEGESWPLQAHLYSLLLEENGVLVQPRYLFIKLDKRGEDPKVFEYKFDKNLRSKCLIAIQMYWENKKSEKI